MSENLVEIWKTSIETQKHFAELSLKMRQLGITLAGGTLALAVVLYRSDAEFSLPLPGTVFTLPIGTVLCLAAAGILYAAKKLDADMYHQMLRGAVRFNELLEIRLAKEEGLSAGLTETISAFSRYQENELLPERDQNGRIWKGKARGFARDRISDFYKLCVGALSTLAVILLIAENINSGT